MPPVVCKFWQQGSCRYGDRCRFDHPPANQYVSNANRFAALQPPDNTSSRNSNGFQGGGSAGRQPPYLLDKNTIITDLHSERPQWILSAYGPGRHAPAQLFGGSVREQSFEEMRLLHYVATAGGNPQHAIQEAETLFRAADQQIKTVLSNVDGAIQFVINAENEHPNRIDICRTSTSGPGSVPNPFGHPNYSAPSQAATGGNIQFGGPSQPSSSSFGTSATPTPLGAFGQPSALGQKLNPFGANTQTFGAPSQLSTTGAFGQPSALGQKPNPFGAPSGGTALGTSSNTTAPFSASTSSTNPFSNQQQSTNIFGAASQPPTSSAFSASTPSVQQNTFAQNSTQPPNPLGPANSTPHINPFSRGISEPFGAPSPAPKNPFGQPPTQPSATTGNPFSNPLPPASNPLRQISSVQEANSNPFGNALANSSITIGRFDIATGGHQVGGSSQAFVNGNATVGSNDSIQQLPLDVYSSKDSNGRLAIFKGMRVIYKDDKAGYQGSDGTWHKIWFPQGAPAPFKDTEMEESAYDENIKRAYMHALQSGTFQGGIIPTVPPKREWCLYDF